MAYTLRKDQGKPPAQEDLLSNATIFYMDGSSEVNNDARLLTAIWLIS